MGCEEGSTGEVMKNDGGDGDAAVNKLLHLRGWSCLQVDARQCPPLEQSIPQLRLCLWFLQQSWGNQEVDHKSNC